MELTIICKIGTVPYGKMLVCNKRKLPVVGQMIKIRKDEPQSQRIWVIVDSINPDGFYFVKKLDEVLEEVKDETN